MGHQVIKQPDGKLAVFSNSVDAWILFDASPAELLDYYAEKAAEQAREDTQRVLDHVLAGEPAKAYYQFAMSFEEADALADQPLAQVREEWEATHDRNPGI